jgi:hypothetical protein
VRRSIYKILGNKPEGKRGYLNRDCGLVLKFMQEKQEVEWSYLAQWES